MKEIESLTFHKFCVAIAPFPENFINCMSNAELLYWLCNYLENTVIPAVNNNGECVTELQNLFTELKNYCDNYFTNLDVQEEINNKLDELAENGTLYAIMEPYFESVENTLNLQNTKITNIENLVNATTNINPLVASSISDMTDTSRIYVLTTNGNWYYHNGTAWTVGGVYQGTGIANNSVNYENINQNVFNNNYYVNAEQITQDGTAECAIQLFYDLTPLGIKSQYNVDINFNIKPNNNIINQVLARARIIKDTLVSGQYKNLNLNEIYYTDELVVTRSSTNYNLGLLVYIYPTLTSRSASSYYIKNL